MMGSMVGLPENKQSYPMVPRLAGLEPPLFGSSSRSRATTKRIAVKERVCAPHVVARAAISALTRSR